MPKKRFTRSYRTVAILLVMAVLVLGGVYVIQTRAPPTLPKIGVIKIDGPVTWNHVHLAEDVLHDSSIKAVVLQVNSPGGSVSASFGLEEAVSDLAAEKQVVANLEALGASGAYLAVSPSDFIYTHEVTITGGLGVIYIWVSYENYFEEEGIEYFIWSTGELKDIGAPWRGPTEEENAMIREWIEDTAEELFKHIVANRPEVEDIDNLKDARILEGYDEDQEDALDYKLVDAVGSHRDAIEKAADLAGLKEGEYKVVELSG